MNDKNLTELAENFTKVVEVLHDLIINGQAYVSLHPNGSCYIKMRNPETLASALKAKNLERNTFEKVIPEVPGFLYASLTDEDDVFISTRIQRLKERGLPDEMVASSRDFLKAKSNTIRSKLLDEKLKQRYFLRKHAKTPFFVDLEWEANVKHADSQVGFLEPVPYATIQVWHGGPSTGLEAPWQIPDDFEIDLTEQDIDFMVSELTAIRDMLRKMK